jgi:DNA helicase-2/ATP-dependent DNA helicase PcrA
VLEADFIGWDALITELGVSGAKVAHLEVAHRSTLPIMRIADSLVGDRTSEGRPGQKPSLLVSSSRESMLTRLADLVRTSYGDNRSGHVCIVCRHAQQARVIHGELSTRLRELGAPIRLGHNKEFEFAPGITVTNVRQIKGLEFDTVVVLEPTEDHYPVDDGGRRALYMVITRAKERLVLLGTGEPSGLLQQAILDDLLELVNKPTVPPVSFTDEDEDPF